MRVYKKIFLIFTLLFALLFVKSWGSVTGFIYSHDDVVYYAQAASMVNDLDVDIKNNLGSMYKNLYVPLHPETGKMMSYQPIGPSLLYAIPYACTKPFVLLLSALRGVAFDEYDPLFFVAICFSILVLFYYSGIFLLKALERYFSGSVSRIAVIFTLWGTILPVYVFRRPVFAVIPEFFWVTLLLCYLARLHTSGKLLFVNTAVFALIFGFISITRWNDAYLLPFCLIFLAYIAQKGAPGRTGALGPMVRHCALFLIVFSGFFLCAQVSAWKSIYGNIGDFAAFYVSKHVTHVNLTAAYPAFPGLVTIKNLLHILLGLDWGVLFTMPVLFFGTIAFIVNDKLIVTSSKALQRAFFASLFIAPFYFVLLWKNTGDFYGYRFLVSLLPFAAFGAASLIERHEKRNLKVVSAAVYCFCLANFFIILPFEFSDRVSLLPHTVTPLGGSGWGNNRYVLNAAMFYFTSDIKTLASLFARGYAAFFIFGFLSKTGFDLARFSPKVQSYFSLSSYRQYVAIVYFLLVVSWAAFLTRDDPKKN